MEKYLLDSNENKEFLTQLQDELLEFGKQFPSPSGASYYLGDDGTPMYERNLETWITCRMAHVYSIGMALGFPGSEELVDKALDGITGILHDEQNGGYFPGVTKDLTPLAEKQCYGHAFVILAASSAYLMGRPKAKQLLEDSTKIFLEKFWDEEIGLSCDTWNTEFTKLEPYRGLNANMHSVEAFLSVADVTGEEVWRQRAGKIIDHVLEWAENNDWRIPEHFNENWQPDLVYNADKPDDPFKPYGATPGHGIEWGRLVTQWALSTFKNKEDAMPYIEKACLLYERAIGDGWAANGKPGIAYTTGWDGKPVVSDRMHWTLAEAINTSSVLYHVTGKEEYKKQYEEFMEYLDTVVHDKKNGSWFHQLDEDNNLKETVWSGKSDLYHALQSTLIPKLDPSVSVAVATKKKLYL